MKKRRKNFIFKIAVLAFAAYIAVTLICQAVQIRQSNEKLSLAQSQLTAQKRKNEQSERTLKENDKDFMESVARNELGYSKPNERIYVDASGN